MTDYTLAFGILLGGMVLTVSAGERPKSRTGAPKALVQNKAVKLLLSSDRQTRGRAKDRILNDAKHQRPKWRDGIASQLAILVATPDNQRDRPESVRAAIELLVSMAAAWIEAVGTRKKVARRVGKAAV